MWDELVWGVWGVWGVSGVWGVKDSSLGSATPQKQLFYLKHPPKQSLL